MTLSPLACLSCGAPFRLNGELASVPEGAVVAFDPAHKRVWRVCDRCEMWNLLGGEAAAVALPELEARFAAAPARPIASDFAPVRLSPAVEILRIGQVPVMRDDVAALKRLREIRWGRVAAFGSLIGAIVGLGWVLATSYGVGLLGRVLIDMSWSIAGGGLAAAVIPRWRARMPINWKLVVLLVALCVIAFINGHLRVPRMDLITGLVCLGGATVTLSLLPPAHTVKGENGERIPFHLRAQYDAVTLEWTEGIHDLSLHDLPGGRSLYGIDARRLLLHMVEQEGTRLGVFSSSRRLDAAYALLRSAGGLDGLLHTLEGFRRDHDGRVAFGDLPPVYRQALDLAFIPSKVDQQKVESIRQQIAEASLLAAEAERLELEPGTDSTR